MHWRDIAYKYRVSKGWFYILRKRFLEKGYEGLRDKVHNNSNRPHRINWEQRLRILSYVYDNPTHGPQRIAYELEPRLSPKGVWNTLKREDLNTRRKRRLWAHYQGKPVLTQKEKHLILARDRHVESYEPGELVSIDTLAVSVKELGKMWQYTACDTYSSYGWAWLYRNKTANNAVDFFMNHVRGTVPTRKIKRILTDQGTEFYNIKSTERDSPFTNALKAHGIKHTVTKVAHPWTNGYVERLNQTIWQEFYLCRLENPYASIEALNKELYAFMRYYNFYRKHTGYKLKMAGFEYPGHAFFDVKESSNIVEIKY
ncbi:MAG: DDE-type integrase/transposase/recombinase [Candidatus Omnitrophica bacterium]|nr:DDE-type integrase/transposase/recombinase [Candidatus Omnitrophota bacterium]